MHIEVIDNDLWYVVENGVPSVTTTVEDIDLRVTRQEGPGYSYGHCQKPSTKLEDGGSIMGLRPGDGLRPVVLTAVRVKLVV